MTRAKFLANKNGQRRQTLEMDPRCAVVIQSHVTFRWIVYSIDANGERRQRGVHIGAMLEEVGKFHN